MHNKYFFSVPFPGNYNLLPERKLPLLNLLSEIKIRRHYLPVFIITFF